MLFNQDYKRALEELDNQLKTHPGVAFYWLQKGLYLRELKRPHESLEALNESLKINPYNKDISLPLGPG